MKKFVKSRSLRNIVIAALIFVSSFLAVECYHHAQAQTTVATPPTLVGTWYLQSFDNVSFNAGAIVVLALRPDGKYAQMKYVLLTDGNVGEETEVGKYRRAGHTVRFVPTSSSCQTHKNIQRDDDYDLTASVLTLRRAQKIHVYRRTIPYTEARIVLRLNTSLTPPIRGCLDGAHKKFMLND